MTCAPIHTLKAANAIAGTLGKPSKMPGRTYGIPARACHVGAKLAKVEGSTCSSCYAMRGNYIFRDVIKSQNTRLASITGPQWVEAMVYLIEHGVKHDNPYFRWHDSGDLQSIQHLTRICAIAALTPWCHHWLPTREASIVARYLKQGGKVPSNLVIRQSATMVNGTAPKGLGLPTSTVHAGTRPTGRLCPAPAQGNKCNDCRACWSQRVRNVSYHIH